MSGFQIAVVVTPATIFDINQNRGQMRHQLLQCCSFGDI